MEYERLILFGCKEYEDILKELLCVTEVQNRGEEGVRHVSTILVLLQSKKTCKPVVLCSPFSALYQWLG